jgi:hypothetical protein
MVVRILFTNCLPRLDSIEPDRLPSWGRMGGYRAGGTAAAISLLNAASARLIAATRDS